MKPRRRCPPCFIRAWVILLLPLSNLLGAISCTSLHAPAVLPAYNAGDSYISADSGVQIRALPIREPSRYYELFDEYLPEVGILALRVSVADETSQPVDASSVVFLLQDGDTTHRALEPDQLFKIYYGRSHIRMYTLNTDETARRDISRVSFKKGIIPPREAADGLIFFSPAEHLSAGWPVRSILVVRGIRLADGRKLRFKIPLAYADH